MGRPESHQQHQATSITGRLRASLVALLGDAVWRMLVKRFWISRRDTIGEAIT